MSNMVVGLDIGTAQSRAVIAELNPNGILEVTGVGVAPSTGVRKGVVVNIEATLASVTQAIEAAELMSGRHVENCYVGIGGANVEGLNSRGVVAVASRGREITQQDWDRVIEAARAVPIPMDRQVFHVIPQNFIVDDQRGIRNPLDMIGVRLEAEVHIITGSLTTAQNLINCVNRAGFKVERLLMQSLAAARATLNQDEKELGCLLVDLGAGTTDILVYNDGAPYYTSVTAVGGYQVTSDISIMMAIPIEAAEKLKRESGSCWGKNIDASETIVIPGVGARAPVETSRQMLTSIIQPRMEEILTIVREKVKKAGHWNYIKGGVVLTGGGALMQGTVDLAHEVFGMPVRVGTPVTLGGLIDTYRSPVYATSLGLAILGSEYLQAEFVEEGDVKETKAPSNRKTLGQSLRAFKKMFF